MIGWEFQHTHEPLKLVEKPDPVPEADMVVVDVKACGLCHSDVGALDDESWQNLVWPNTYLGHEFAGLISAVGSEVKNFKVGDRVGVCPTKDSRGQNPSYFGRDGAYATKAVAPEERLVHIPEGVSFVDAAAATDAGMTSYHAIMVAGGMKPGTKIGIIGIGGLGQWGVRAAVLKGGEVYVATRNPEAQKIALDMGAKAAVSTPKELKEFNCEMIVDFAGGETTTSEAINAVAEYGRVVLVGMATMSECNAYDLINNRRRLIGSGGGDCEDIEELYRMIASGDLVPRTEVISFDEIPAGLDRLRQGGLTRRLVAVMD
ncbi:MAG: alcohol dehydrogenase catalytic domain-containing protein [Oscillospiraceae bacterium]|jgi:propanol-preferring alcohol dehydrogenase|nr:alcohol dehydrogenase catalytic domain-containing protein [Oscillospiraceae bacterium]